MILKPPKGSLLKRGHPLAKGLVGCWLMNEGGGNRVNDLSGNGNTGTITDALWTPDKFGPCLSFDGTGDYVGCGTQPILGRAKEFTVSLWARQTALTSDKGFLAKYQTVSPANQRSFAIRTRPDYEIQLYISSNGTGANAYLSTTNAGVLATNTWYFFTWVYRASNTIEFWRDGVFFESLAVAETSIFAGTAPLEIGYSFNSANSWNGRLDDVLIYNRALYASEVQQLYREPFAMFGRQRIELWSPAVQGAGGGTAYTETLSDSLGITDASSRASVILRSLSDGIGAVDAYPVSWAAIREMADSLGITDLPSSQLAAIRVIAEAMGVTDLAGSASTLIRSPSDSIGLTDLLGSVWDGSRLISDPFGLADAISKDETKVLADAIGLLDTVSQLSALLRAVSDTLGLTDEASGVWGAVQTVADSVGITDAVSRVYTGDRTIDDDEGVTDAVVRALVMARIIADSEGITDGAVVGSIIEIAETMGISDEMTAFVAYLRTMSNTEGMTDAVTRLAVMIRGITDSEGMSDVATKQLSGLIKAFHFFLIKQHS